MRKIAADLLFTTNTEHKSFAPIKNGCITIGDKGEILEIRQLSNVEVAAAAEKNPKEVADGGIEFYKGIICPGFVNAHCHIELSHLKGAFEEATGMSGFINQINALRNTVDKQGRLNAMKAEFENFYNQGIAGCADISNCDESFELKKNSPVYFRTFVELFGSEPKDAQDVINGGIKLQEEARAMGLDAAVTPHSCYTISPKLLEMAAQEGLKSGYLSYHSQESQEEEDMIMKGTGALEENYKGRNLSTPPVTGKTALHYFIDRLLSFSKSPVHGKINLIHNVVISQKAIDYAREKLVEPFFTICPLSNIFIHRALPPLELMRRNELTICLGTDSLSSNKVLSMVEEIKCVQEHFPEIPLEEILGWACINGATAIGKEEELGSIAVGKRPGVVLIDNIDFKNFKLTTESKSTRLA
ncbi:MAG: amidohydrolase family protein [Bacteroidales bacterium]|jgi:aminodeoxyfutalosine deaminase|nr:amidohydrolase family protein [Bacteroidales bacterium]MCI1733357.1 amidohydrolase family protein [Bacteroidales bacterium]